MSRFSWTPPSFESVTRTFCSLSPVVAMSFEQFGQDVIS
jgi:hypothetical protein